MRECLSRAGIKGVVSEDCLCCWGGVDGCLCLCLVVNLEISGGAVSSDLAVISWAVNISYVVT